MARKTRRQSGEILSERIIYETKEGARTGREVRARNCGRCKVAGGQAVISAK